MLAQRPVCSSHCISSSTLRTPGASVRQPFGFSNSLRGTALHVPVASCSRGHVQTSALIVARQGGQDREGGGGGGGGGRGDRRGGDRGGDRREQQDEFQERVVQVSRVTKVVKGGKQLSFRAVVVVGNEKGSVGVGCAAAKEVVVAVQKAVLDAKRHLVTVPMTKSFSFPHKLDGEFGAAKVMLRPAAEGAGVIAGGSVRVVLELAGIKNGFGKQLGSGNPLNNARATVQGLANMKTFKQVSKERGISVQELMGFRKEAKIPANVEPLPEAAVA